MKRNDITHDNITQAIGYKLLALVAFAFIIGVLFIIADVGAATGYEISIYNAYPLYFWLFIIFSLTLGISILVIGAFSDPRSNWWLVGLAIVILNHLIIFLLPLFREYVIYGNTDPLLHIGYVNNILTVGHFGREYPGGENFYPASHILAASISFITNLSVEVIAKLLPSFFFGFYVVSIYLLAGAVGENRGQQLFTTALASLPPFTMMIAESKLFFVPRLLIFWQLPFILFLFYQGRKPLLNHSRYILMLVLTLLVAPFWHPTNGGLFLFGLLLMMGFVLFAWKRLTATEMQKTYCLPFQPRDALNSALIVFVTFWLWFANTLAFAYFVPNVRDTLLETGFRGSSLSEGILYLSRVKAAEMPLSDFVILLLKRQGSQLFYFSIAGIVSLDLWRQILFSKKQVSPNLAIFSFLFLLSVTGVIILTFIPLPYEFDRVVPFVTWLATMVLGLRLFQFFSKFRRRALMTSLLIVVLFLMAVHTVFISYPSPFILAANGQVTLTDIEGMKWFMDNRNENILTDSIIIGDWELAAAFRGMRESSVSFFISQRTMPPKHFGYDQNDTYGAFYKDDRYFLNHERLKVYSTHILRKYPKALQWTPEDFERLENDPTVSRIYNNGDFEVFFVKGIG